MDFVYRLLFSYITPLVPVCFIFNTYAFQTNKIIENTGPMGGHLAP